MKKNILVPVDFSEKSLETLNQSYKLAKLFDAEITILHVRQDTKKTYFFSLFSEEESNEMKKNYVDKIQSRLKEISEEAMKKFKIQVNIMLAKGRVSEKVVEIAETINAEFIIIDKHTGDNNPKDYIGIDASRIIRTAQCPVLIWNNYDFSDTFKNIILPIDLSEGSRQKISYAVSFSKICGSSIKVIAAIMNKNKQNSSTLQVLITQIDKYLKESNVSYSTELIKADDSKKSFPALIFEYAEKYNGDIIVIMTQKETGWVKAYISPVALEVISNSELPVLSITPKDINLVVSRF